MTLYKTRSVEETQSKLAELAVKYGNSAYYFTSGSPVVIDSTRIMLKEKGIRNKHIIDDTLKGY